MKDLNKPYFVFRNFNPNEIRYMTIRIVISNKHFCLSWLYSQLTARFNEDGLHRQAGFFVNVNRLIAVPVLVVNIFHK